MFFDFTKNKSQYIVSVALVLIVSVLCFSVKEQLNYRTVALILLLTVSVIAMLYDIFPVLLSALLSAFIWNYCFIPPVFTLDIKSAEDLLMFLSYFFVALLNAVLTYKIKQAEKNARDKEEKEKTIKLYNTLLNSLSHELRTPIATILGTVDTLKDSNEKLNKVQQFDLLNDIDIASIRLNRQVENILNMSRLESDTLKPKLDWCDVNELVNSTIQKVNGNKTHIIIFQSSETLPLFKVDIGFTEQILLNLLHNAVQYTPAGTTISIEAAHEKDNCVFIVKDNGQGIAAGEIPFVFDKFYRIPQTKAGGSGLGLSIAKGFTEAQNGTIQLESNTAQGTKFTLKIPANTSYLNNLKNE
jgi:two-component system sensor histidine kinase KdpD